MKNIREKYIKIAEEFCSNIKKSNIAITGSTNYGGEKNYPNNKSDLDLIVLDNLETRNALDKICLEPKHLKYLDDNRFYIVCIKADIENIKVNFNLLSIENYLRLCFGKEYEVTVFKDLREKRIKENTTAPYYISSFNQDYNLNYKIEKLHDGHSIVCPTSDKPFFTINSFQDQILTQTEINDYKNYLSNGREVLTKKVIFESNKEKSKPLNIHRVRIPRWRKEFTEIMRRRYEK